MDDAACRGLDTNLFFPERGDQGVPGIVARVCGSCPVQGGCRDFAMARWGEQGIWGGLTHDERKTIKRRERRAS